MDGRTVLNISRPNGFVSLQDRVHLVQLANTCEAELPVLRRQIEETERRLSLLVSSLQETEKVILVSRALSKPSPIHRLPPELLSFVFVFACAGETLKVLGVGRHPQPTLLSLLRVCKHWRDLAFRTKCAWKNPVSIDHHHSLICHPNEYGAAEELSVVEGVVNLYGESLSHLYLNYDYVEEINRELFDLVFQNQRQFVSLVLYDGDSIFEYRYTFEMPMLEKLFLLRQTIDEGSGEGFIKFEAPRLKKLFLRQPEDHYDFTPHNPSLPWSQITHLSFGPPCYGGDNRRVSAASFFDLLSHLPCLAYLHITQVALENGNTSSLRPCIVLPRLKALEIHDQRLWSLGVENFDSLLLPSISTPSLETFDLFFSIERSNLYGWGGSFVKCYLPSSIGPLPFAKSDS